MHLDVVGMLWKPAIPALIKGLTLCPQILRLTPPLLLFSAMSPVYIIFIH